MQDIWAVSARGVASGSQGGHGIGGLAGKPVEIGVPEKLGTFLGA